MDNQFVEDVRKMMNDILVDNDLPISDCEKELKAIVDTITEGGKLKDVKNILDTIKSMEICKLQIDRQAKSSGD